MGTGKRIMLFAGTSNPALSASVAGALNTSLCGAQIGMFADGEISVRIDESVRGHDVFVLQSVCPPVNDRIMELLVILDALKRSSAGKITAVLPYYAYARQDRQESPRRPITAKLVADLITVAGADRVMSIDLHSGQIQGFFSVPFEHLRASRVLVPKIAEITADKDHMVVVSPDAGGVERARYYSKALSASLAIIDKRRSAPNVAEVMHVIGDVEGKSCVIVDDMIDTAGTLTKAAAALIERGARDVYAAAAHPVLSGPAVDRISNSALSKVFVTDTIPLSPAAACCEQLEVCSVGGLLGEAITRVHVETSVSSMFR